MNDGATKTMATGRLRFGVAAAGLMLAAALPAQEDARYGAADRAAAEGRLADMEAGYDAILSERPGDVRALTGRAAALAWQRRFAEARRDYLTALRLDPDNVEARVGLGYAYAWDGQYTAAQTEFNRALATNPRHKGARKGIGYSYLWAGHPDLAVASFDIAASIAPRDAEIPEAIGRARMQQGRYRDAIAHFDTALGIDPQRDGARDVRRQAYRAAPVLELHALAGSTTGAGSGLRALEVAHWSSPATRLGVRYDNSLGLDNPSIADRSEDAHSYSALLQHRFARGWTLAGEAGRRELAGGDQNFAGLQAVVETAIGNLKVGGQLGDHDAGYTDRLVYAGIGLPWRNAWYLEPIAYFSQTGFGDDREWRLVLNATRPISARLTAGALVGGGAVDSENPGFDGSSALAGLWFDYATGPSHGVSLLVRHEQLPARNFTVVELGFTYRLPRN